MIVLLHILNYILTTFNYHISRKYSKIIPITKINQPTNLSHYCLINILQ